MGFKGVTDFTANTVTCTSFDNCNRNIKTVGLVTIDDRVLLRLLLIQSSQYMKVTNL